MRVALLLLATAIALPAATAAASERRQHEPDYGDWRFHAYSDEATGHDITMLVLPAKRGRSQIMIACEEQELYVLADFGRRLSTEDLDITERLGQSEPIDRRWEIAKDSWEVLVHPTRGAELLQHLAEMEAAGEVDLTVTPDGKPAVRSRFHTVGLSKMLPRLAGCVPEPASF
jgi:hypothetical protein